MIAGVAPWCVQQGTPCIIVLDAFPPELGELWAPKVYSSRGSVSDATSAVADAAALCPELTNPQIPARSTCVGARVPVLLPSLYGTLELHEGWFALAELVVVALGDYVVVTVRFDGQVAEAIDRCSDELQACIRTATDDELKRTSHEELQELAGASAELADVLRRRLAAVSFASDANMAAASIAHWAAETLLREVLEVHARRRLTELEGDVGESRKPTMAKVDELHELRSALGEIQTAAQQRVRGRCSAWRFGEIRWKDIDERPGSGRPALRIYRAVQHIDGAADETARLRRDALDVLVMRTSSSQLSRAGSSVQILAAALAGPGLLLAAWQLDVWQGAADQLFLAALFLALLTALVFGTVHLADREGRRSATWAFAGLSFAVLVLAGFLAPKHLSTPRNGVPAADGSGQECDDAGGAVENARGQELTLRVLACEISQLPETIDASRK